MTVEILMAAKLEIGVFLLAALLHFLLFSTRAPGPKVLRIPFGSLRQVPKAKTEKVESPAASLARALKPMVRSGPLLVGGLSSDALGAQASAFEAELRSHLKHLGVSEWQPCLAQSLESAFGDKKSLEKIRKDMKRSAKASAKPTRSCCRPCVHWWARSPT